MPEIVIEQAICAARSDGTYQFAAQSPGFLEEWLPEVERLCRSFGEPRAGFHCPRGVFAQPFGHRRVAVVQVEDRAGSASSALPRLAFHFMVLQQATYRDLGGDPFQIAAQFAFPWNARGELPALTLPRSAMPPRMVAQLE